MVKGNKQVTFMHYRDGDLWYRHDGGFEFPVPIADVGTATMLATDKALLFMRYIRKHAAMLEHANTQPPEGDPLDGRRPAFARGDLVRKRSGSQWQGCSGNGCAASAWRTPWASATTS